MSAPADIDAPMPIGAQIETAVEPRPPFISFRQAGVERRKAAYQEATVRAAYLKRGNWTQPLYADLEAEPDAKKREDAIKARRDHLTDSLVQMESICEARGYGVPPERDRDLEDTWDKIERYDRAIAGGMRPDSAALMFGDFAVRPPGRDDEKHGALARLEIARRQPARRGQLFSFDPKNPDPELRNLDAYWRRVIHHSVDHLHLLWDTADFHANDFLRLLYLYGETPVHLRVHATAWRPADRLDRDPSLPAAAEDQMLKALLEFKYWMDEEPKAKDCAALIKARGDWDEAYSRDKKRKADDEYKYEMTYWSENHQILFPAAEYLAGQWMPDGVFMPGRAFREGGDDPTHGDYDGRTRMARAKPRILRWLNDRLRFGFSEWNAPGYYKEHLQALFNLGEYCVDDEIRTRTHMVMDVLFFDLARFSQAGLFGATAGRAYFEHKSCGWEQGVADLAEMAFGTHHGIFSGPDASPAMFASNRVYQVPDAIIAIAQDAETTFVDRSRVSFNFDEAHEYGIGFAKEEDILRWWSRGAYFVKQTIGGTRRVVERHGLMHSETFAKILPITGALDDPRAYLAAALALLIMPPVGLSLLALAHEVDEEDIADFASAMTEGSALTRANLYTYRSPHATLSSVQDFRPGQYNFQTHTCQASLSMGAMVWTSHPSAGVALDNLKEFLEFAAAGSGGLLGGALGEVLGNFVNVLLNGMMPGAAMAGRVAGAAAGAFGGWKAGEAAGDLKILPVDHNGPTWWTGSVTLPRVVQHGNAAIIAYKPGAFQRMLFGHRTHAWFPKAAFDKNADADDWAEYAAPGQTGPIPTPMPRVDTTVRTPLIPSLTPVPAANSNIDTGAWIFGRVGDGYVALYSAQKPEWTTTGDWADREIMAEGERNVFILQVGTRAEFGSYVDFKRRVLAARVHVNGLHWSPADFECSYDVPGGKRLELHYDDDQVRYAGLDFSDDDFPRARNPYAQIAWGQNRYAIQHAGVSVVHDLAKAERRMAGVLRGLVHDVGLSFFFQNMGLFYMIPPYNGTERDRALDRLIEILREEPYDVVGLCEMWHHADRSRILDAVGELYPYHLEGPNEPDLEYLDGGLLLLSRHKIVASNATIYRQYAGEEMGSNKGALHARIHIPGQPCDYDLFLSHTQNLTPKLASHAKARQALKGQIQHLAGFVQAYRDPRAPALLMGDLNVDELHDEAYEHGQDTERLYDTLIRVLGGPTDLNPSIPTSEAEGSGISSFNSGNPDRSAEDLERFGKDAQRLDYFLSWPGAVFEPSYGKGKVLTYQSSPGRDLSDHYGIRVTLDSVRQRLPTAGTAIRRVGVTLTRFSCLQTTSGPGSDEVQFMLRCVTGRGEERSVTTATFEDVDTGDRRGLDGLGVTLSDPGEFLWISVSGKEIDDFSADDDLGTSVLRLDRYELALLQNSSLSCALPRLTGDGSEYVVEVQIEVQ